MRNEKEEAVTLLVNKQTDKRHALAQHSAWCTHLCRHLSSRSRGGRTRLWRQAGEGVTDRRAECFEGESADSRRAGGRFKAR